jgi:hypothetical protein
LRRDKPYDYRQDFIEDEEDEENEIEEEKKRIKK